MRVRILPALIWLIAITGTLKSCKPTEQTISQKTVDSVLVMMKDYQELGDRFWYDGLLSVLEKGHQSTGSKKVIEDSFVAFLNSGATPAAKNVILYHLGPMASDQSVEILVNLLSDEENFDAALYALSYIPDGKIDQQLFDLIDKTSLEQSIAIVNTLGDRANPEIAQPLSGLLYGKREFVPYVLAALGNIPSQESASAISQYMDGQQGEQRWQAASHLIQVANALGAADLDVSGYYERAFHSEAPPTIIYGALKGLVAAGQDPIDKMLEIFNRGDEKQISGIIPLIRELRQLPSQTFISESLEVLPEVNQYMFLIALADAGDQRMKSEALELVQSQDQSHQVTGLKMILRLGGVDEISLLANLAANLKGEAKLLARKCLYSIPGNEFDTKVTEEVVASSGKEKEELILALGNRNVTTSKEMLVELMRDEDQRTRLAAMKSLAMIGDPGIIPKMLANADQLTGPEQTQLVRSITVLTAYIPEPDQRDDAVARALDEAKSIRTKTILIDILGNVANEDAYQALFPLLENGDPEVRAAAVRALSEWPDDRPLTSLADYFVKAQDNQLKLLALQGVERLTNISDSLAADGRAKLLIMTLNACKTDDERKIVLSGLGKTGSLITFEAAIKLVSSKAVGSEAEAAILQNIRNIDRDDFSAEIKQYLRLAQEKSSNENFKKEIDKWLSDLS